MISDGVAVHAHLKTTVFSFMHTHLHANPTASLTIDTESHVLKDALVSHNSSPSQN
jgi:hypothetical protein